MSELQPESEQSFEIESDAVETTEELQDQEVEQAEDGQVEESTGADLAPAETVESEKNTDDEAKGPDWYVKKIGKQTKAQREAERKAEELQKRLDDLESQSKSKADDLEVVPPLPDTWDDNYQEEAANRDAIIERNAAKKHEKVMQERTERRQEEERQYKAQQEVVEKTNKYMARGVSLGIDEDSQRVHAEIVAERLPVGTGDYLLSTDDGPALTAYLATNSKALDDVSSMSPVEFGMKIADIRKAIKSPSKRVSAPPPPETVTGRSAPKPKNPLLEGATFE